MLRCADGFLWPFVNRLLFNPIIQWWRKGPINRQINKFLWCKAPLHYKISMMACTCFCLASFSYRRAWESDIDVLLFHFLFYFDRHVLLL